MKRQKWFHEIFREDIREKRVLVVNDNANTMSAWSVPMLTQCQHSKGLHGHCVSVVNHYADTWEIILLWKK